MTGRVVAVVGAQYGSEGKGVIVHHIADRFNVHVRVGGPNAGHSFFHGDRVWKMRALPVGWTNPDALLVIGAGAVIDLGVLMSEIEAVEQQGYSVLDRLRIDAKAWCITASDRRAEEAFGFGKRVSSTLEGVGYARIRRIQRDEASATMFKDKVREYPRLKTTIRDTVSILNNSWHSQNVLLEGTQGMGLSLIHGEWPYVTSADTGPAQLLADCGLPPSALRDVLLVARTMPIRVGGPSGPLNGETSWDELSVALNKEVREYTTVTGKLRRIGDWDRILAHKAVARSGAQFMALTFLDYWYPEVTGTTELPAHVEEAVRFMEQSLDVRIPLVGVGGREFKVINRVGGIDAILE